MLITGEMGGGGEDMGTLLSTQFSCRSKTAKKIKV